MRSCNDCVACITLDISKKSVYSLCSKMAVDLQVILDENDNQLREPSEKH